MTFDIEKMLREGATPTEINKAIAEATATAQKKIDAEKAEAEVKRNKENEKVAKAKVAADALNDFLRTCGICGPKEEVFTSTDLLDAVDTSLDDLLSEFLNLFSDKPSRKSIFDKYLN